MNTNRSQMIFIAVIAAAIAIVALGLVFRGMSNLTSSANGPGANTPLPPGAVEVSIESSNTKEDWMNEMVKNFNASGAKTGSGQPIVVTVKHGG